MFFLKLIGLSIGGPYVGIVVAVVIVVVGVALRLYLMRRSSGGMRAKCPKCSNVFDASRSFSVVHVGTKKMLKCPACGKTSFIDTYVKDSITWPPEEKKPEQPEQGLSAEEQEKQRIEESKYEKS